MLAVTILFLAVCDWHVLEFISYHKFICRFLSAICMQALFPYSPTLTCLAFLYPTFGKRTQSIPTSASELGVGASEHVSTPAEDKTSIDDVIAKLNAAEHDDPRAAEILAATITLRDSSGRDRKAALRRMANTWSVILTEKIVGKYKPRSNEKLAEDIQCSVCKAALKWELRTHPSQISFTRSHSVADAENVLKKTMTSGVAEHGSAVVTHASVTVHQLSETPDDVMTLSRLGPTMYQATLRSGRIWQGNAELLNSLPQGMARLATLQVRERVAQAKAKPKVKAKAESSASFCGRSEHGEDGAPDQGGVAELHGSSAKKQRTLKQMFLSSGSGRVGGEHVQAVASEHGTDEHDELGASHDDAGDR